jgi:hypothetical protein
LKSLIHVGIALFGIVSTAHADFKPPVREILNCGRLPVAYPDLADLGGSWNCSYGTVQMTREENTKKGAFMVAITVCSTEPAPSGNFTTTCNWIPNED